MVALLDELLKWVDEIPPLQQPQRFGNQAFKTWYARLAERGASLLQTVPGVPPPAVVELAPYLIEGFGNSTRIDYGSGTVVQWQARRWFTIADGLPQGMSFLLWPCSAPCPS
jgi:serine/threonine-protein phosphatase 2A activator